MHVIRSLCIAFSTYSRIPVPQVAWTDENRKYSMCFFPLIGAVIGLLLWGWLALCDVLGFGMLSAVAGNFLNAIVTVIQAVLENFDLLLGNDSPPDSTEEFFSLAAKHAAANDLYPSAVVYHISPWKIKGRHIGDMPAFVI